ncbi:GTP-binding protein [candidate division KSB3 bacterium]|uniref:GTP-binding protein n=1 Tax=candidate division KSB3 bacterium TaxID=2044937 RepID=A0A2G6K9M7_9BACT|nr:MAG: GTP-binding protein [candidate division KSB3 bacterium]
MNNFSPIITHGKLIAAITSSDLRLIEYVEQQLSQTFGSYESKSDLFSFDDFTSYYALEMGTGLQKKFVSFQKMIPLEEFSDIKLLTNHLEQESAHDGKRRINLDPGYVTHAQMVLATTKNYSHRIYIGKGIYGELTYVYKKKAFHFLEWTYPDYREPWAIAFFENVRMHYLQQVRTATTN